MRNDETNDDHAVITSPYTLGAGVDGVHYDGRGAENEVEDPPFVMGWYRRSLGSIGYAEIAEKMLDKQGANLCGWLGNVPVFAGLRKQLWEVSVSCEETPGLRHPPLNGQQGFVKLHEVLEPFTCGVSLVGGVEYARYQQRILS